LQNIQYVNANSAPVIGKTALSGITKKKVFSNSYNVSSYGLLSKLNHAIQTSITTIINDKANVGFRNLEKNIVVIMQKYPQINIEIIFHHCS
jgi:hypothetical protein